ncbi:MAG: DUF2760 domain-containing protein [Bryobacteraceae bacterium]|nr:DUF2760 domain-containing protein [Bryobacteraceae bacterium]
MGRLSLAIRSFFALLFKGALPGDVVTKLNLDRKAAPPAAAPPKPAVEPGHGALQMLAILQRDSRLVDFLMEDISSYSDDQIGAAVRGLHEQCREALHRYVRLAPVIDGVEGSFVRLSGPSAVFDPARVKLLGNVPAQGLPEGGLLRHKGWRADKVDLPPLDAKRDLTILAPAEVEVE